MVKKKIDNRIRTMIENGVKLQHRTMFIIVGDKGRDQVPILYDMLTKSTVKARPTVLWCYKNKDDAISNYGRKKLKKIQAGKIGINEADLFDAFRVSTTIHGRYYSETHTILGRTYGVCVLQDFEALTPNLLARTIETVEGGGLVILLLKTLQSLKQLYTMSMDVHKRYRTEAHRNVTCRFNERLILSLANCDRCLLVNDDLTILPLSSKTANVQAVDVSQINESPNADALRELQASLSDVKPAGVFVNLCKTYDQAKAIVQFIDALAEKQLKPPTPLTAARGRGKSAAMGLAISAAIAFGYVNVYVTSPHPENLITLFEFVLKGFDALEYQEHIDYTIIRSTNPEFKRAIIRINVIHKSRQTIQYISPSDTHLLNAADLLVIDEAAAIPLPIVKKMIGPYLIFMASTINGYEGTGRSLSLKLIAQMQKESNAPAPLTLDESIRYRQGDAIELWLSSLLCLNVDSIPPLISGCPTPDACELYYIDRDALFSYHRAAEAFLQRLVSIYVSSHYKNSPNDLQMMSDAPAHHLFCLLGPITKKDALPEILVVIQLCLEGQISTRTVSDSLSRGRKAAGDLIPWNVSEQFNDRDFPNLAGARVVRIATHPNYQKMGYGKRAVRLLKDYYTGKFTSLNEHDDASDNDNVEHDEENADSDTGIDKINDNEIGLLKEEILPRKRIPTLLKRLTERKPEKLDYIGTSYGLTIDLLRFWKSQKFVPVYLSQRPNELTGEYSIIMLTNINTERTEKDWLSMYFYDFRRRFMKLLGKSFKEFSTGLALSILDNNAIKLQSDDLTRDILDAHFLTHDIQRLELYSRNQIEYRLIYDLTYDLAIIFYQRKIIDLNIDAIQKAILLGIGLQHKTVDHLINEFDMPANQLLAKFYDCINKITKSFLKIVEQSIEKQILKSDTELNHGQNMQPTAKTFKEELDEDALELAKKQREELKRLKKENLSAYAIKGTEAEWGKVLLENKSSIVSVKSGEKRLYESNEIIGLDKREKSGGDMKKKRKFKK